MRECSPGNPYPSTLLDASSFVSTGAGRHFFFGAPDARQRCADRFAVVVTWRFTARRLSQAAPARLLVLLRSTPVYLHGFAVPSPRHADHDRTTIEAPWAQSTRSASQTEPVLSSWCPPCAQSPARRPHVPSRPSRSSRASRAWAASPSHRGHREQAPPRGESRGRRPPADPRAL